MDNTIYQNPNSLSKNAPYLLEFRQLKEYFNFRRKFKADKVDKSKLGYGVTSKTTAKITYLQETIYSGLSKYFNEDISNLYYESQKDAIKVIKDIVKNNNIDCDLEKSPSIIFTLKNKNIKKLRREEELLRGWNNKVEVINNPNIKYIIK